MSASPIEQSIQLFELEPGKHLDLQINHPVPLRLKLALIGYEIGKYIILKYPKGASKAQYNDVLVEGNVVIIRYILEGNKGECFAFRSSIKYIAQHPEKLLFIQYPTKIENRQLRMQQRTSIHLPATIMLEGSNEDKATQLSGIIGDISTKGCGFSFKSKSINAKVNKREILVCLQSPTSGEIRIPAKVCNSRNNQGTVSVGIQFIDNTNLVSKLLNELFIDSPEG